MQAIVTKYLGPTNHRGARVKAQCQAGSIVIPWDDALDTDANHDAAARALICKLGWDGPYYQQEWYRGGSPKGDGNVYVCSHRARVSANGA